MEVNIKMKNDIFAHIFIIFMRGLVKIKSFHDLVIEKIPDKALFAVLSRLIIFIFSVLSKVLYNFTQSSFFMLNS